FQARASASHTSPLFGYTTTGFPVTRAAGVDVREVVLTLPEDRLRERIDADQVEAGARGWRHDHVARALATFASVTDARLIDASAPPEQVADAVAAHVRAETRCPASGHGGRQPG
ncbi:hypothetical protein ACFXA2_03885, partial [Micromonospora chalcea]